MNAPFIFDNAVTAIWVEADLFHARVHPSNADKRHLSKAKDLEEG
ncbi:MAG: hypothetical protein ABI668_10075 [Sphingorhabdus sp.]